MVYKDMTMRCVKFCSFNVILCVILSVLFFNFLLLCFTFCCDVNAILSQEYVYEKQIKEEMVFYWTDHKLTVFGLQVWLRKHSRNVHSLFFSQKFQASIVF